jgi:hypothetical protein
MMGQYLTIKEHGILSLAPWQTPPDFIHVVNKLKVIV